MDHKLRTFMIVRDGVVLADGVVWPDESSSVRWRGEHGSVVFWPKIESVVAATTAHLETRIEFDR